MKRTCVLASKTLDDVEVVGSLDRGCYCSCRIVLEFMHVTENDKGNRHTASHEVVIRNEVVGALKDDIERLLRDIRKAAADVEAVYLADFAAANAEFNKQNNPDAAAQNGDGVQGAEHATDGAR